MGPSARERLALLSEELRGLGAHNIRAEVFRDDDGVVHNIERGSHCGEDFDGELCEVMLVPDLAPLPGPACLACGWTLYELVDDDFAWSSRQLLRGLHGGRQLTAALVEAQRAGTLRAWGEVSEWIETVEDALGVNQEEARFLLGAALTGALWPQWRERLVDDVAESLGALSVAEVDLGAMGLARAATLVSAAVEEARADLRGNSWVLLAGGSWDGMVGHARDQWLLPGSRELALVPLVVYAWMRALRNASFSDATITTESSREVLETVVTLYEPGSGACGSLKKVLGVARALALL